MTDWIDRNILMTNAGGDAELAREVLAIFKEQVDTWGRMLDPKTSPKSWADAAHTLKGAALGIGAQPLAEVCKLAEDRGREEPEPSIAQAALLLNDIRDVLLPTEEAVAKLDHQLSVSVPFSAS